VTNKIYEGAKKNRRTWTLH